MSEPGFSSIDQHHMARALELSRLGLGRVEPNPMVGAVVADGQCVVATGYHAFFGGPHAEAAALAAAGDAARGATLYVTLEPCCHHGKTPPCTEAILAAGIRRVVAAMEDPFPEVHGRGLARLREAGLIVEVGLMEQQARRLNAPFIKRQLCGRPYVTAKWAMTLDGRLAAASGDSKWVSSDEARRWVHTLRSRMDAICIGSGTAACDDPQLTVRLSPGDTDYGRRPARLVLDPGLTLSPQSLLVRTAGNVPLIVATAQNADPQKTATLTSLGAEALPLPTVGGDTLDLGLMLDELGRRGMTHLLVEGGSRTLTSFFAADLVDAVAVFVAPKLIGGRPSHVAPGPSGLDRMSQARAVLRPTYTPVGDDLLIQGVLRDY
jgi:diaminohydroxyphosphoribosylaminopyrimidine deaminase/5-amino-6-(5-phosphoribosylamino)uracil reductase